MIGNSGKWTAYEEGDYDYMWYIDLEYKDDLYRGVYFTEYRSRGSGKNAVLQEIEGYYKNCLYWFKWEPIEWRVLENNDNEMFLMSNLIIDSQHFYHSTVTRTIDGKTIYPDNWKESDIRVWLNDTFYNWAFDKPEQSVIKTTLVDNGADTVSPEATEYVCEDTNDNVFLLSYSDMNNTNYFANSSTRELAATNYTQCCGIFAYKGKGIWRLRSPNSYSYAFKVDFYGYISSVGSIVHNAGGNFMFTVDVKYGGVVPAIKIAK